MTLIKAIIWDLDETFWSGTLSEEGITPIESNIDLVKRLTDRGIINSISSKNHYDQTKQKLEELGVWSYFVFAKIGFYAKGNAVKDTIEAMGLRPVNVLFIDDNHLNLKEVQTVVPSIHTMHPDQLPQLESLYDVKGKDDREHSRLNQYKLLEQKHQAKSHYDTDLDFLRDSNIHVYLNPSVESDIERLTELVSRTNQLNFTKQRDSQLALTTLVRSDDVETLSVKVADNYGDYGLVGFIALNKQNQQLVHFVFSCRILNLGVEQFLYHHLGAPELNIVGDVSGELDRDFCPDWIALSENAKQGVQSQPEAKTQQLRILLKGGCDLTQMTIYLTNKSDIEEEVNYTSSGNMPIHPDHSYIMLGKTHYRDNVPFLPRSAFESQLSDPRFDYVIFSVLMDYTQDLYRSEDGHITPFAGYYRPLKTKGIDEREVAQLEQFYKTHTNIGPISGEEFYTNLNQLLDVIAPNTRLILINGAEVEPPLKVEPGCVARHKEMNKVVDRFVSENSERVTLVDVRKLITSTSDYAYDIRHYKRRVYQRLAEQLSGVINQSTKTGNAYLLYLMHKLKSKGVVRVLADMMEQVNYRLTQCYQRLLSRNQKPVAQSRKRPE
ncbi:hypothetical protein [Vibrio sp. WXL210]|uniref:hypothetical protein n=1 Tax=Vibrio sp. WXL210 TaxID=3450709 RepID=UPI003EC5C5A7